MTEYMIFVYKDDDACWEYYSNNESSSPARAIRQCEPEAGKYVAVPARSWQPLTVKVEQTTKITIG